MKAIRLRDEWERSAPFTGEFPFGHIEAHAIVAEHVAAVSIEQHGFRFEVWATLLYGGKVQIGNVHYSPQQGWSGDSPGWQRQYDRAKDRSAAMADWLCGLIEA